VQAIRHIYDTVLSTLLVAPLINIETQEKFLELEENINPPEILYGATRHPA
jgi:hypothetical protein